MTDIAPGDMVLCPTCKEHKKILTPGKYATVLECNHVITSISVSDIIKQGANGVEAESISKSLNVIRELPKIDAQELIERALGSISQTQEEFFTAENVTMEDLILEHGKENAVLIFTAIHSQMSRVLFTLNRFRNFYYTRIESMRKEVEDKAVKELISNHDFHYTPSDKKPKKVKTIGDKILAKDKNSMLAVREAASKLTDKNGNPIDLMQFMTKVMWTDKKKEEEKSDYKAGLDKIKESITHKEKE